MDDLSPLYWPISHLQAAYKSGDLSPVEVTEEALARIAMLDGALHAFRTVTQDIARAAARGAHDALARGEQGPLLGVPVSVKDTFHLRGVPTTLGSLIHQHDVAETDSGVVRRLRSAGAVFTGKTNTAEFGQSATTENLLGPDTRNPWDLTRTPGGSSGGAAASVAAGLSNVAVGSDGGGSIRIPAAFTGLFGLKPTGSVCRDEGGFRAMTDFVSAGPLTWRVADARIMLGVLADRHYPRQTISTRLRVAWCARPEGRPVDPGVADAVASAVATLAGCGHDVVPMDLPLHGWSEIFGPLVLADEWAQRGHLLGDDAGRLTRYERRTLEAGGALQRADVDAARRALPRFRRRIEELFTSYDVLVTPTVAVPAFPLGQRPHEIAGNPVDALWGAFPFAAPFNVAETTAASLPCGLADGVPVGVQLVAAPLSEQILLDLAEELEEAIDFDRTPVIDRWRSAEVAP